MPNSDERESVWSVAKGTRRLYYAVFIVQYLLGIAFATARAVSLDGDGFFDTWTLVWVQAGALVVASAANAIILTEIGRFIVVLANILYERVERTRRQRRAEGRAEVREYIERELASAREKGDKARVEVYEKMLRDISEMETSQP